MPPVTFYPGPSKVYPQVRQWMQDAYDEGVLSQNHRSEGFMDICRRAITGLKQQLSVPSEYGVMFVSSATECWEIIAQSLTREQSFHVYNGAFGSKWLEYAQRIRPLSAGSGFGLENELSSKLAPIPRQAEVICLTQNETSNATQVSVPVIRDIKRQYPDKLIAVDATSSLGGLSLDFSAADIWFASVQKCLGLPAGLGVLICSPQALERARQINDRAFYNSLLFVYENFQKNQTPYTPNVLDIYLLMRLMEVVESIDKIDSRVSQQANDWYTFLEQFSAIMPLIQNSAVRSQTVIAVQGQENTITQLKEKAKKAGIILGNGYGDWKSTTFRLANFPAISHEEIRTLQHLLQDTLSG